MIIQDDEKEAYARFVSAWKSTSTSRPGPAWSTIGIPLRLASAIRPPASSNVLLHAGRSGSTVLNRLLNQHPKIHFEGEVLGSRYNYHFHQAPATMPIRTYDVGSSIRRRWWRSHRNHYRVEVKMLDLPVHGRRTLEAAASLLKSCGSRLIVIRRRNVLRRFISAIRPELTGSAWHQSVSEVSDSPKVQIDLDRPWASRYPDKDIEGILQQEDDALTSLGALAREAALDLWFEDHIRDDPTVGYTAICETIGVEPVSVTNIIQRTNPGPISSIVENAEELRERLEGSRWAWMIEAD